MQEAANPCAQRIAAEVAKVGMRARLIHLARWIGEWDSPADAEDLVSGALARACDPADKPWNPPPGFLTHMGYIIRDLSISKSRRGYGRFEVVDSGLAADEQTAHPDPLPDAALVEQGELERLRELGRELRARVSHMPHAVHVFDLGCQGIDDPAEVAEITQCRLEDVYQARRTLKRYANEILKSHRKTASGSHGAGRESRAREVGS